MWSLFKACILAIFLLVCSASQSLAETGTVTASALVLRTGPGLEYNMISELPYGAVLTIDSYSDGWFLIDYGELRGYIHARYVLVSEPSGAGATPRPATTPVPLPAGTAPPGTNLPTLTFTGDNNPGFPMVLKPGDMGNSVIDLQTTLQTLGYTLSVDGKYGYDTQAAVMRLQRTLGIEADGIIGAQTRRLIGNNNVGGVELLEWWKGGNTAYARLTEASVVDVRTGKRFKIYRHGGDSHLDAEPLTKADTAIFLEIAGGQWTWDRRPIWLEVNGRVIAASMNCMPHAGQHITTNNFNGQFCIHMIGSKTHGSDRIDEQHQTCIQEAWNNRSLYTK